jgi:four helix bundle protein
MGYQTFEKLRVYRVAESLSIETWKVVLQWDNFTRDTVGKQLVRAADSVGANIAEGCGRRSYKENRRFVRIARGSFNETRHWLRLAFQRRLLSNEQIAVLKPLLEGLSPLLNAYLNSIGTSSKDEIPKDLRTKGLKDEGRNDALAP